MRNKAISIRIAEPCNQDWGLMEDRKTEKFCESCQKCVVDFSQYTNAEIVKVLLMSQDSVCGRLTNVQLNQLNYYLISVPSNKNWLKYLGVLAIGASIFVSEAKANSLSEPIELISTSSKAINGLKIYRPKMIYGYVFDENKKPIVGAQVLIVNTKLFATTDKNGRYEITLDNNFSSRNNIIKVESLRFEGSIKADYSKERQADLNSKCVYMIMGKIAFINKS